MSGGQSGSTPAASKGTTENVPRTDAWTCPSLGESRAKYTLSSASRVACCVHTNTASASAPAPAPALRTGNTAACTVVYHSDDHSDGRVSTSYSPMDALPFLTTTVVPHASNSCVPPSRSPDR